MKKIYAPWRCDYVNEEVHGKTPKTNSDECIFCKQFAENNDEKYFILKRSKHVAVLLNLYPYNAGHVMIIPFEHKANLSDLSTDCRLDLMEEINNAIVGIKKELKPDGFNVGINLGKTAGAGIPSHIHVHTVPRWQGDTNFFPIVGDTKAISFDLTKIYKQLKTFF